MAEQTKRGPGRPRLKERANVIDIHLNVPADLLDTIDDSAEKVGKNRKQFILEAVQEKLQREHKE